MDLRYREVTVGSIVIVAILVFIFGTMWLSGRRVSAGNTVRIQFANVSGLKRASPVRVSRRQRRQGGDDRVPRAWARCW